MIEIKGKYNTAKVFTDNIEEKAKAFVASYSYLGKKAADLKEEGVAFVTFLNTLLK